MIHNRFCISETFSLIKSFCFQNSAIVADVRTISSQAISPLKLIILLWKSAQPQTVCGVC